MNFEFSKLTGYFQKEIEGLHLELLLLPIYRESIREYLIKVSNEKTISIETIIIVDKNGYLIQCQISILRIPSLEIDDQLFMTLSPIKEANKIIVGTDMNLRVLGISEGANTMLALNSKYIAQNKLIMKDLCPTLFSEDNPQTNQNKTYTNTKYHFPKLTYNDLKYYKIICPLYKHFRPNNPLSSKNSTTEPLEVLAKKEIIKDLSKHIIGYIFHLKPKISEIGRHSQLKPNTIPEFKSILEYNKTIGMYIRRYEKTNEVKYNDHLRGSNICQKKSMIKSLRRIFTINAFKDTKITFEKMILAKITMIERRLDSKQLCEFTRFLSNSHKIVNYEKDVKSLNILDVNKEIKPSPPKLALGEIFEKVADKNMKCPGNVMLIKQSEDYRLKLMLSNIEQTTNYIKKHFKPLLFFKIFLLGLSILIIGMISSMSAETYLKSALSDTIIDKVNLTMEGFSRAYLETISSSGLLCVVSINK